MLSYRERKRRSWDKAEVGMGRESFRMTAQSGLL